MPPQLPLKSFASSALPHSLLTSSSPSSLLLSLLLCISIIIYPLSLVSLLRCVCCGSSVEWEIRGIGTLVCSVSARQISVRYFALCLRVCVCASERVSALGLPFAIARLEKNIYLKRAKRNFRRLFFIVYFALRVALNVRRKILLLLLLGTCCKYVCN